MTSALTVVRRVAIAAVLGLVWLRPGIGDVELASQETELAVLLVVDRTTSMGATDLDGRPRFDRVRADLVTLVESLPATTFSVIGVATEVSTELPPTTDRSAALQAVDDLRVEDPVNAKGSSLERPVAEIRPALDELRAADPDQRIVLVVVSDGENTAPPDPAARPQDLAYTGLAARIDDGAVLGYGTAAGGTMPLQGVNGLTGALVPDPSTGQAAVSRLDEPHLRTVADDLDVPYLHRDSADGIATVVARLSTGTSPGGAVVSARELTWAFALALLALLSAELRSAWRGLLAVRRDRRTT